MGLSKVYIFELFMVCSIGWYKKVFQKMFREKVVFFKWNFSTLKYKTYFFHKFLHLLLIAQCQYYTLLKKCNINTISCFKCGSCNHSHYFCNRLLVDYGNFKWIYLPKYYTINGHTLQRHF